MMWCDHRSSFPFSAFQLFSISAFAPPISAFCFPNFCFPLGPLSAFSISAFPLALPHAEPPFRPQTLDFRLRTRNESAQPSNALHVPALRTKTEAAGTAGDNHPANEEPNHAHIRSASQTTGRPATLQGRNRPLYSAHFLFQKSSKRYMLCYIVKHTAKYSGPWPCDYAGQP
jgi:hypothetical protein